MTIRAYIGIGSNLNDPVAQVQEAIGELEMLPDTILVSKSSLYRGKPMGPADQPDYVNAVVGIDTLLSAGDLLQAMHRIEDLQGRERQREQWGPRTLDLDLLLYGGRHIDTERLVVPHPQMHRRAFVLVPLADVAPDWVHPVTGRSVRQMLDALPHKDISEVTPL